MLKFPSRSEIEVTTRKGNMMRMMKAIRNACAPTFFQRRSRGFSTIMMCLPAPRLA